MSSVVSIEIPSEVVHATRMTPQELKRELAVYLFQQNKLSFGKAREMAGMTAWAFQQLLGSRGIPIHYDLEDYEEDLETLKELGRLGALSATFLCLSIWQELENLTCFNNCTVNSSFLRQYGKR